GEAEAALRRRGDAAGAVLEVGRAVQVKERVPAVVVAPGERAREVRGRRDRGDAVELVLERLCAGPLGPRGIHARRIEGAELLVRRLWCSGRARCEAIDDAAQRLVVALDQLCEAAVARVLGWERGARQPAAVRVAVGILARGVNRLQ